MSYVDNTKQPSLKTMSIGPGIRGIERGIERSTRLDHKLYVEIEAFIIENLVAEMEAGILDSALIWSDAKTLPSELFRDKIDLLIAGYPCQPFSTAGQRKGVDDPRHLFPHIGRAIDIIRPAICFFENVRGHITMGLKEVIEELERLGYRVHWGIFSAEETGAAHKRERVFIMAVRNDILENSQSTNGWITAAGLRNEAIGESCSRGTWKAGVEMGNSEYHGSDGTENTEGIESGNFGDTERSQYVGEFERSGSEPCGRNEELADTGSFRGDESLGGGQSELINQDGEEHGEEWVQTSRSGTKFPSRPGQPQQAWESPRVISRAVESEMGMSTNGYHFREDFLRALGNSVYPPTAELAWNVLSKKHGL